MRYGNRMSLSWMLVVAAMWLVNYVLAPVALIGLVVIAVRGRRRRR